MRVGVIGEGLTEYLCVPTIAGRLGNTVTRHVQFRGSNAGFDWEQLFRKRIAPLVNALATASPDKIVIVLDREERDDCPGNLASRGMKIVKQECGHCLGQCEVAVIVSDREFETILFADYDAVDRLEILQQPISKDFPATTDCHGVVNWLAGWFKPGHSYDRPRDGKFLAQRINLSAPEVLHRCRALRKLVKELSPKICEAPINP